MNGCREGSFVWRSQRLGVGYSAGMLNPATVFFSVKERANPAIMLRSSRRSFFPVFYRFFLFYRFFSFFFNSHETSLPLRTRSWFPCLVLPASLRTPRPWRTLPPTGRRRERVRRRPWEGPSRDWRASSASTEVVGPNRRMRAWVVAAAAAAAAVWAANTPFRGTG